MRQSNGLRRRLVAGVAVAALTLTLAACGSSSTATNTTSSAAPTSAAGTSAGSSSAGSGSPSASSSGGVGMTTGGGTGEIDQEVYDGVINGGPVADAATVSANAWAAAIKARGVLNTGGSDSGPLFSLLDPVTGKLTGFDAGLAQLLARYIIGAPEIKLTVTTVDTRETLIQNATVDTVIATYTINEARAQKIAFAGPYFISGSAIMVHKDTTDITKLEDLAGKTVAVQQGSTQETALPGLVPTVQLVPFAADAECQAAVTQGRTDAYVVDQSILISDAVTNDEVKVVGEPFTVDPYGIGVTRDDPAAKQFVNDWLTKIYADGTWAKLWKATIGTVVEGDAPTPPAIGSVPGT